MGTPGTLNCYLGLRVYVPLTERKDTMSAFAFYEVNSLIPRQEARRIVVDTDSEKPKILALSVHTGSARKDEVLVFDFD
jgi:hypothetical protein